MVLITGKKYDVLKVLALVVLPALASAYFILAGILDLSSAEEVAGTIMVLDTILGVVLQLSSRAYAESDARFDGSINVLDAEDGVQNFSMNIPADPEAIMDAKEIRLKVNRSPVSKQR